MFVFDRSPTFSHRAGVGDDRVAPRDALHAHP